MATVTLDSEVFDLNLSMHTTNALARNELRTVAQIVKHSAEEILRLRNVGQKSVAELEAVLARAGLSLRRDAGPVVERAPLGLDSPVGELVGEHTALGWAFHHNGIRTIAHLIALTEDDVRHMSGIGPKKLDQLKSAMSAAGLAFGAGESSRFADALAQLEHARWIGHQLDVISTDHRAQPTRSLLSTSPAADQIEKRRYAWRMFRWVTGRDEKWPRMHEEGAAFEVYPLPGSVEAHLDGLNRLAHEELGDE